MDINRIGTVSSIDKENGMVSVIYNDRGGKVTPLLPFLSLNDEYKMPQVGDKVFVAHLSNGTESAVVLGKYWNKARRPQQPGETYRKQFDYAGEAFVSYDEKSGELLVNAAKVKIVSGCVEVTSDVSADGISLGSHTHTGVSGETSRPN